MKTESNNTVGDYFDWVKDNPVILTKPLCKQPRYMDEVWVTFGHDEAFKGWVLGLTGGDFGTSMKYELWGDMITFFFPPVRGEKFYRGKKLFWLMDIGIGKTKEEALNSFEKHDWFKRSKEDINFHRWLAVKEKMNK